MCTCTTNDLSTADPLLPTHTATSTTISLVSDEDTNPPPTENFAKVTETDTCAASYHTEASDIPDSMFRLFMPSPELDKSDTISVCSGNVDLTCDLDSEARGARADTADSVEGKNAVTAADLQEAFSVDIGARADSDTHSDTDDVYLEQLAVETGSSVVGVKSLICAIPNITQQRLQGQEQK